MRTVHCADALAWLSSAGVVEGASFVTSLPDVSELSPMPLDEWKRWFSDTARRIVEACPREGVAIFFQTDVVFEDVWIDKAALVLRSAEAAGADLLWHRIVCRRPPGELRFGRPGYSHMLCVSRGVRPKPGLSRVDVLPDAGETSWARGMGLLACADACRFVLDHTTTRTIVDPFCGHGSVLAVAEALGLDAVGVELGRKRAQKARNLRVELDPRGRPLIVRQATERAIDG